MNEDSQLIHEIIFTDEEFPADLIRLSVPNNGYSLSKVLPSTEQISASLSEIRLSLENGDLIIETNFEDMVRRDLDADDSLIVYKANELLVLTTLRQIYSSALTRVQKILQPLYIFMGCWTGL